MALKVELKPGERILVGESLITNADGRTILLIQGDAPILREKDILTPEMANTLAKRLYLCVQMMYLEKDIKKYQSLYFDFARELLTTKPQFRPHIEAISNLILTGAFYKSLREARNLVAEEEELLKHV